MSEDRTPPIKEETEMGENSPDRHGNEVGQGDEEPQNGRTASNNNNSDHEDHKPETYAETPIRENTDERDRNGETTSEAVAFETADGNPAVIKTEEPMDTQEVTMQMAVNGWPIKLQKIYDFFAFSTFYVVNQSTLQLGFDSIGNSRIVREEILNSASKYIQRIQLVVNGTYCNRTILAKLLCTSCAHVTGNVVNVFHNAKFWTFCCS